MDSENVFQSDKQDESVFLSDYNAANNHQSVNSSCSSSECDDLEFEDIGVTSIDKVMHGSFLKNYCNDLDNPYHRQCLKIYKKITKLPDIQEILELCVSDQKKQELVEKLMILTSHQVGSHDFFYYKNNIEQTIEKYKQFKFEKSELKHYDKIRKEIEQSIKTEIMPLEYMILGMKDRQAQVFLYEKYKYLCSLDETTTTYIKLKRWLEQICKLPTTSKDIIPPNNITEFTIKKHLWNVRRYLDTEVYGMPLVKEQILAIISNRIQNPHARNTGLALCGPPGVAKTSIITALAKASKLPFYQINLGGAKDSAFLLGHNYTYEGSMPGTIVQALNYIKYNNGIIYFDELDKVGDTPQSLEIVRSLLHITDSSQNNKFHDRYISENIDIDLSKIWFIYSMNDASQVDKTLLDRINIIHVPGYTDAEKKEIVQNFIVPKILKELNFNKKDVRFSDDALDYLIQITNESSEPSGVRHIKDAVENILMKLSLYKTICSKDASNLYKIKLSFSIDNLTFPFVITRKVIYDIKLDAEQKDESYLSMYS